MKVEINISKITDSPYNSALKDSFLIEDNETVNQLVRELNTANPSTFLVSGYRGAGKTSFINQVIQAIGNDTVHVNISLAKFDGYFTLIKKLIRQLYLSFENSSRKEEDALKIVRNKLELLYDRTFHDVVQSQNSNLKNESESISEKSFDLKKIIPVFFVAASGTVAAFDIIKSEFSSYILFISSLIWASVSSWNLIRRKLVIDTKTEEISRKTLYDDEIAEYHLFEILKELKSLRVKVLIVFDELDKIQPPEVVNNIINELKSLLLSGNANFIVISGQGLYYQLERSQTKDDSILSSLFSKTVHIPFLKYATLKKICLQLIVDSQIMKSDLFNNYFDSLILQSGRVPRKLSNLIRNRLIWENEKAYILIDDNQKEIYSLDSRLLKASTRVLDSELPKITLNVAKQDFFTSQIHLWIFKIKSLKSFYFTVHEIIQKDEYLNGEYPTNYINQLEPLCHLLFDLLIDDNILRKKQEDDLSYYNWVSEEEGKDQNQRFDFSTDPDFVKEFADLEQYIKGIYLVLVDGTTQDKKELSIRHMLNELISLEVLSKTWYNSKKIDTIISTRNRIVDGTSIEKEDLNVIQKSRFDIARLKGELIEAYTYSVSKRYLTEFDVQKKNNGGFDFVAKNRDLSIVFEVKYLLHGLPVTRNINEIIDKFTNYLKTISSNSFYVLFFYQPNGRKSYDSFYSKFFDIIKHRLPEFSNRFMLYYISGYIGDANTRRLETHLSQILDKVNGSQVRPQNILDDNEIYSGDFEDAKKIIRENASKEWPDDYDMQLSEIKRQEEAIKILLKGKPEDISQSQFVKIRSKVKQEWPYDYDMRVSEERRQFEAIRKLKGSN